MSTKPPTTELEFLKASTNHLDLSRRLTLLGIGSPVLPEYAKFICLAWFKLGQEHLAEAQKIQRAGCVRAAYSRAYYAAYNASKGLRYLAQGSVSLKGDDHSKASSELPGDYPENAKWAAAISKLYENRLRADYDNWSTTASDFSLTPAEAVKTAEEFIDSAKIYLLQIHQVRT